MNHNFFRNKLVFGRKDFSKTTVVSDFLLLLCNASLVWPRVNGALTTHRMMMMMMMMMMNHLMTIK